MEDEIKKLLKNQKGQAIFELILFLPFLIFMLSIYYTIGNSLSGSINQQKAVRGYFYALTKNNSYVNTAKDIDEFGNIGMRSVGFSALGWREKSEGGGKQAFGPCFSFASMLKNGPSGETCDGKERGDNDTSNFIRVFTFYGVCGPVYSQPTSGGRMTLEPTRQNNPALCSLD